MASSLPRRPVQSTVGSTLSGVLESAGVPLREHGVGRAVVFAKTMLAMYETPEARKSLGFTGVHALLFHFLSQVKSGEDSWAFSTNQMAERLDLEPRWCRMAWKRLQDEGWIQKTGRKRGHWHYFAWGERLLDAEESSQRMRKL